MKRRRDVLKRSQDLPTNLGSLGYRPRATGATISRRRAPRSAGAGRGSRRPAVPAGAVPPGRGRGRPRPRPRPPGPGRSPVGPRRGRRRREAVGEAGAGGEGSGDGVHEFDSSSSQSRSAPGEPYIVVSGGMGPSQQADASDDRAGSPAQLALRPACELGQWCGR